MKLSGALAIVAMSSIAISSIATSAVFPAHAQTAIQAGEWEVTEKTTMEGVQPMEPTSKKRCLVAGEAQLERLLFPTPEEMKEHACQYQEGARQPGILRATLTCPPSDKMAGVTATAEITYSATSYKGLGQLEAKDKSGTTIKGKSELSGRRVGDC